LVLVIEDNLCNNYCNISLNRTCRDFLYKWTSSHMHKGGKKNWHRTIFKERNLGQPRKNLNLIFFVFGRNQAAPPPLAFDFFLHGDQPPSPSSSWLSLTSSPPFSQTRENSALALENFRFPSSAGHRSIVSSQPTRAPITLLSQPFFPFSVVSIFPHRPPKPAFSIFTDLSSSSTQNKSYHFPSLTQSFLLHNHCAAREDPATPVLSFISFNRPRNQPKDSSPIGHSPRSAHSPLTEREQFAGRCLRQDTNRPPTAAQTGRKPKA